MRKSLLIAFFVAILISMFALPRTLSSCAAQSSTPVTGIIYSDTVWTKTNSPYTLTGAVGVISGVTLAIEAGVTINLGNYYIQVNGTLNAKGSFTDPIYFNGGGNPAISFVQPSSDLNEQDGNDTIENAVLASSEITVVNSSPKIINNTLLCRISLFNSSSLILNNYFLKNEKSDSSGLVAYDSNATISGNVFTGLYQALYVGSSQSFSTPLMERNLITENHYGILMPTSVAFSPTIRNNTIANNTVGIGIWNGGTILPTIIHNNIYGNREYNFRLTDIKNNITATQNWWGTADAQAIGQTIYDFRNDFNLGNITFVPFLTEPSPQAMPDPNMLARLPTPTPMPEQSTTPSPIPVPGQSFFFVESNSTISELFFNSTSSELSFTASGASGTAGYVKVTIAKTLVSGVQKTKVYFDGSQLNVAITENADSWLLSFTYLHSTHKVTISLATNAGDATSTGAEPWVWIAFAIIICTLLIVAVAFNRRRKGLQVNRLTEQDQKSMPLNRRS